MVASQILLESNPNLAQFMGGLVHQDDKLAPPLQAADMIAHLSKGRFIDWLDDPEKKIFTSDENLQRRLKRLSVHKIVIWDRRYMLSVLAHEAIEVASKIPHAENGTIEVRPIWEM